MRTLIIGEMGSTPEGNLDTMKRLVDCAAECGCDVVKNQWTSSAQTMCDRRHAPEYLDSYLKLQYPLEWHAELREHTKARGLKYGCSCYIPGDFNRIAHFLDYLKLSSFEAGDAALLTEALRTDRRVLVSVGMRDTYEPILPTLQHPAMPYGVLHCCTSYPAPLVGLNLAAIRAGLAPALNGFSDHSHDVRVGAWAVAAGASILETHFRLDDCDPANKDYAVAFTPAEFAEYIRNVRDCEAALGDGVKTIQDAEKSMLRYRVKA